MLSVFSFNILKVLYSMWMFFLLQLILCTGCKTQAYYPKTKWMNLTNPALLSTKNWILLFVIPGKDRNKKYTVHTSVCILTLLLPMHRLFLSLIL